MYVVVVFFNSKPQHTAAFRSALLTQAHNSLEKETGCRQFDVSQDPLEPNAFFLYEIYDDAQAFKVHLESEHFKAFNEHVTPMTESKRVLTYDLLTGHGQA